MAKMSNSLVKQFAKTITQSVPQEKSKSSNALGTLVKEGNIFYAMLDGSTFLTPVSMSMSGEEGDRVLVTIQNHSAIVTSNITAPGATTKYVERVEADLTTFKDVTVKNLLANYIRTDELEAKVGTFGYLKVETAEATYLKTVELEAKVGTFGYLKSEQLESEVAKFGYLKTGELAADVAKLGYLKVTDAEATYLKVDELEGKVGTFGYLKVSELEGAVGKFGYLTADQASLKYAQIDFANVTGQVVGTSLIKDGAITDAKILGLSANKITAGILDAAKITVTNLNADNITVGTLNGKLIGTGSVDLNKLAEEVPTKEYLDYVQNGLQGQIDKSIQTYTVTAIPLLNNEPAQDWSTEEYPKHVGDVCYVVNPGGQADGYTYRFEKDGDTYGWSLIKDSQVTEALQKLLNVDGDLSGLKSFQSETSSWITKTDSELSSVKSRTTTIETTYSTKAEAKNLADDAKNGAIDEAAKDATSKANEAKTDAINTAASDATSKANSAKSEAITAAASDATSKANSALDNAKKYAEDAVDGIEIGGRNLLKNSHKEEQEYAYPSSDYRDQCTWVTSIPLNGEFYTLSFWAKSTVPGDAIRVHFYNPSNISSVKGSQGQISSSGDGLCDFILTTTLTKYWVTYTIPKGGNNTRDVIIARMFDGGGKGTVSIKWEKVEKGTKATDWTPAPEDIDQALSTKVESTTFNEVKQTVDTNSAKITQMTKTLKQKADGSAVESLQQTVNTVQQTANENVSKISQVTQSVEKAQSTADDAKAYTDAVQNQKGYRYKTDIVVYGDRTDYYYPIYLAYGDQNVSREIVISREYNEHAPDDWYIPTHKGGLILRIKANYGGWDGAEYKCEILDLNQKYCTMVGDVRVNKLDGYGIGIWLRGGGTTGAIYHIYSDQQIEYRADQAYWHTTIPIIAYEGQKQIGWYGGSESSPHHTWISDNPLTTPDENHLNSLQALKMANTAKERTETISQTVNEVKQTADSNSAKITQMNQTVAQKADGSKVTKLEERTSSVEQNLSGFKSEVGSTYTTKTEFENLESTYNSYVQQTDSKIAAKLESATFNSFQNGEYSNFKKSTNEFIGTSEAWEMRWNKIFNSDNAAEDTYQSYITFKNGEQILGNSKSNIKLHLKNDVIQFEDSNGNALASFDAANIYLGKNSKESIIDLCNSSGKIAGYTSDYGDIGIELSGPHYVNLFTEGVSVNSDRANKSSALLMGDEYVDIFLNDGSGGWASKISLEGTTIKLLGDQIVALSSVIKVGLTEYREDRIELYGPLPYIDFHYGNSTADYTSRIFENSSGNLNINGVDFRYNTLYSSNWFRSTGNSGWYNENYGGGIFMEDTTWVKVFNGKSFYAPGEIRSDNHMTVNGLGSFGQFRAICGNYGFMIRNDGVNTYFLVTNAGDPWGGWANRFPLIIDNAYGTVTIGNGCSLHAQGGARICGNGGHNSQATMSSGGNWVCMNRAGNDGTFHGNLGSGTNYWNTVNYKNLNKVSDKRKKRDLGKLSLDEALLLLTNIQTVKYSMIDESEDAVQYGVFAQDIRDMLCINNLGYRSMLNISFIDGSEQMTTNLYASEDSVTYGVDYIQFIAPLIKGWQYHNGELSTLKREYQSLQGQYQSLQGQYQSLQGQIEALRNKLHELEMAM